LNECYRRVTSAREREEGFSRWKMGFRRDFRGLF